MPKTERVCSRRLGQKTKMELRGLGFGEQNAEGLFFR
jgi:hypothetical protein